LRVRSQRSVGRHWHERRVLTSPGTGTRRTDARPGRAAPSTGRHHRAGSQACSRPAPGTAQQPPRHHRRPSPCGSAWGLCGRSAVYSQITRLGPGRRSRGFGAGAACPSDQTPMITTHSRLPGGSQGPLFTLTRQFPLRFAPVCVTVAVKSWGRDREPGRGRASDLARHAHRQRCHDHWGMSRPTASTTVAPGADVTAGTPSPGCVCHGCGNDDTLLSWLPQPRHLVAAVPVLSG